MKDATAKNRAIGQELRAMRREAGLEEIDLALMLGIRVSKVYGWEKGTQRFGLDDFIRVCEALDLDPVTTTSRLAEAVRGIERGAGPQVGFI